MAVWKPTTLGWFDLGSNIIVMTAEALMLHYSPEERGRKVLGTLVHEMLHAANDIYVCKCDACWDSSAQGAVFGYTHHGGMWCSTIITMARSIQRQVPGLEDIHLHCGIVRCLESELNAAGNTWKPTAQELDAWGLHTTYFGYLNKGPIWLVWNRLRDHYKDAKS